MLTTRDLQKVTTQANTETRFNSENDSGKVSREPIKVMNLAVVKSFVKLHHHWWVADFNNSTKHWRPLLLRKQLHHVDMWDAPLYPTRPTSFIRFLNKFSLSTHPGNTTVGICHDAQNQTLLWIKTCSFSLNNRLNTKKPFALHLSQCNLVTTGIGCWMAHE